MSNCTCSNFPSSLGNITIGAWLGVGMATSPAAPLEVRSDNNAGHSALRVSVNGAAQTGLDFNAGSGTLYLGGDNAQNGTFFVKNAAGAVRVALAASGNSYFVGGNVGIGTSTPTAPLDVAGTPNQLGIHLGNGILQVGPTNQAGLYFGLDSCDMYVGGTNAQDGDIFVKDRNGAVQLALKSETASLVIGSKKVADSAGCYYA